MLACAGVGVVEGLSTLCSGPSASARGDGKVILVSETLNKCCGLICHKLIIIKMS